MAKSSGKTCMMVMENKYDPPKIKGKKILRGLYSKGMVASPPIKVPMINNIRVILMGFRCGL
jgi:hypothetical protein